MTKTEIDKVGKLILEEVEKTQKVIAEYKEQTQPISPDDSIGRVSRMDAINNKSVVEAALRTQENKLRGLMHVKSQINEENFGLCNRCKTQIPIQRILLVPHNKFCVNCAK
ncbi:MAG: TraR/DksA family transcriptional regulator [Salibacteraceae bacterium]